MITIKMTDLENFIREELVEAITEDRLCSECHMERLEYYDVKYRGSIKVSDIGKCDVYECVECGCVDVYVVDEQKWIGDYDYLKSKFVGNIM